MRFYNVRWMALARRKYCPACGTRMVTSLTTQQAINQEGRPVQYYNVVMYECPKGHPTATFDFSQASLDPGGRDRGFRMAVPVGPEGEAVVTETFLDRFDLSWALTVIGLSLGYLLFAWGLIVIPGPPAAKIIAAVVLTLSAFYILAHMTSVPEPRPGRGGGPAAGSNGAP